MRIPRFFSYGKEHKMWSGKKKMSKSNFAVGRTWVR